MTRLDSRFDYHGLHVAEAHVYAEPVEWVRGGLRIDRVRVRDHTCSCQSPIFELCTAGGIWVIRRLTEGSPAVSESPWMSGRAAFDLWTRIVTGQAR